MTIGNYIEAKTNDYASLGLFKAFAEDKIPLEKFPEFFKEQYMTSRWFQDLIWATTEINEGPYAEFAKNHRKVDSGHHKWMKADLANFGLTPMTSDDWFRMEWLPTRIHMSRILSLCYDASPEVLMTILLSLESAGSVTLGTLFGYVERHDLLDKTFYLGNKHLKVENNQVEEIHEVAKDIINSENTELKKVVDTVFDALTTMFTEGGKRYYAEYIN